MLSALSQSAGSEVLRPFVAGKTVRLSLRQRFDKVCFSAPQASTSGQANWRRLSAVRKSCVEIANWPFRGKASSHLETGFRRVDQT